MYRHTLCINTDTQSQRQRDTHTDLPGVECHPHRDPLDTRPFHACRPHQPQTAASRGSSWSRPWAGPRTAAPSRCCFRPPMPCVSHPRLPGTGALCPVGARGVDTHSGRLPVACVGILDLSPGAHMGQGSAPPCVCFLISQGERGWPEGRDEPQHVPPG